MTNLSPVRPPCYHHFVLLVWEERDADGQRLTWRFSLQDPRKNARFGFKNLDDLMAFLKRWMETPSE